MNECKKVHRLLALRSEDWSAVERDRVEAHMTDCPNCAALAEQYAEQDRLIRAAPRVKLTPSQRSQLLARIQLERRRHEMHTKLSAMMGTAAFIAIIVALALGLRGLFPQIGQPTPSAPTGPYPTDADEALWVHIDGAWDKNLAHRTTTILQRQPWWDGEIILFSYEDNFPDVTGGGQQRVLSWVLAEPDDPEPGWAVLMSGNREVAHWPADQNVPITTGAYTFWLSERQDRRGRTLSVIYGPWAGSRDVPETVQLVLNDQTLDIPLENDSFLYLNEERLVEKRPEIKWACASPDGSLCGISLRADEPRPETEPLVFAGEIRYDGLAVDWLTGKPIPLTLGDRDPTDPFAPGRLYIPSHVYWSLTWRVVAPPSADWRVFVHLYNEAGELTLQSDVAADWLAQPCPEDEYDPVKCTTITDEYEWVFPADFPPGLYTIKVGLYDPVTGERAPVTSPPGATSPVALGQVRVISDAEITPTPVDPADTHALPDQWIAFSNQDEDVCLVKPDGQGQHCLPKAEDRYRVASLAWSPDGQTLAYTYYYGSGKAEDGTRCCPQQVMFYDLDSQHVSTLDIPEEIFPLPGEIIWFPNGRYLLAGRYDKYVIDISTGQVSNAFVTSLKTDVFWSPDGERLIFTSEQVLEEGEKRPVQSGNAFSLAVLEIGQQEPRILCEGTRETDYFPLAWLPDGRVFYKRVERGSDGRISQITHWTIHLDDEASEPQPAQDIPFAFDENAQRTLLPAEFQNAWSLSLSADERWLIFTWRDHTTDAKVPSDSNGVYLFDLKEDGDPVLLAYGDQPAWRPGFTE